MNGAVSALVPLSVITPPALIVHVSDPAAGHVVLPALSRHDDAAVRLPAASNVSVRRNHLLLLSLLFVCRTLTYHVPVRSAWVYAVDDSKFILVLYCTANCNRPVRRAEVMTRF